MFKKSLVIAVMCVFMLVAGGAYAKRIEVKKSFFTDLKNGKLDIAQLAYKSGNVNLHFENDIMEIEARPLIMWQGFTSPDIRRTINREFSAQGDFVFYANGMGFRGEAYLGGVRGIVMRIRNKTPKLLFIDLNKSAITAGSYYGAPLSPANKNHENPGATHPPLLIPPMREIQHEFERADFYRSRSFGWTPIYELPVDKNMLGYCIFAVGDKDVEYVTFELECTLPLSALKNYRRAPGGAED